MMQLTARLHPHWADGKAGYLYSVLFDGKLLVERSPDPQFDAARALLAQGITGKLTLLDGKTGRPRIMIDIEKAAKLRTYDDRSQLSSPRTRACTHKFSLPPSAECPFSREGWHKSKL
jgi:hypothetical protein